MPINATNTENNENLNDVSGEIDSSATDGSENQSPKSLQDMVVAVIAQDPFLSRALAQDKSFEDSRFIEVLKKIAPFIQILPTELKCELIMFLPLQDWKSLRKVNIEWRQVVNTAAKIFLDQVERDTLPVVRIDANDFDAILKKLLEEVDTYAQSTGRRAEQVQVVRKLKGAASSFIQPLEKLMYCKQKINELQRTIEGEHNGGYMLSFFSNPNNSRLHGILKSFLKESQDLIESSPWLEKIKFCTSLYPQHAVVKRLAEALLEIKGQKSKGEQKPKLEIDEEKRVSSLTF
ncbi:hypothetical protein FOLKNPGA_03227 [Legionella sp. PC1000]|uniref:hypothetical protein n=1 Tax=Legionella sp. PC1000 TaxID=2746060 RepID=UPI0015FACBDA|nr:hypothetical protein [Legionella sp. PC1000]QLZ70413.1 hypothetical protein FOLKNPGA_03227 [Legionella sp. PC1000]